MFSGVFIWIDLLQETRNTACVRALAFLLSRFLPSFLSPLSDIENRGLRGEILRQYRQLYTIPARSKNLVCCTDVTWEALKGRGGWVFFLNRGM